MTERLKTGLELPALTQRRAELTRLCSELVSILNVRQALAEEIADLNHIHGRCDELRSFKTALQCWISELESQLTAALTKQNAEAPLKTRNFAVFQQLETPEELFAKIARARRELSLCLAEADQLTLEMVARQSFITETTQQLLRRLAAHAPDFAQARAMLENGQRELADIEATLNAAPSPMVIGTQSPQMSG